MAVHELSYLCVDRNVKRVPVRKLLNTGNTCRRLLALLVRLWN